MRWLYVALIAAVLTSASTAQDRLPDVDQHSNGSQVADNTINAGSLESLTDNYVTEMLRFETFEQLSQTGSNIVNSIVYAGDIDNVVQHFSGVQAVHNRLELGQVEIYGTLEQSGTNLAGAVIANSLNFADQLFSASGQQLVLNKAEIAILYGSVGQYGSNTANYAEAALAIGSATQTIEPGATQSVENRLQLAAMSTVAAISQRGENFGNIMISDTVDSVVRNFAGDQVVHNVITLSEGTPGPIYQDGSNVANFIMASRIGSLSQTSIGSQLVINEVFDAQGTLLRGGDISQASSNTVNMIVLTNPGDSGGGIITVDQTADFPQHASGSGAGGQTGNSVTVDR